MEIVENKTDGLLALFQTTKAERTERVNDLLELVCEGKVDPLAVFQQLKCMEDMINQLTSTDEKKNKNLKAAKEFKAIVLAAAEKLGKKFELHNAAWALRETGVKYDYTKCGDPVIAELLEKQAEIKAAVEERQAFLQGVPIAGTVITILDTGETVHVYPPAKTSTTSVIVSLK